MQPVPSMIKGCRLCGAKKLVRVLSLGNQHLSDFVTITGSTPRSPLELVRCTNCNLVQLRHTFPRESLYRHYWYRSGISSTMRDALQDIAMKACEVAKPSTGDLVVDIGCNDGTLLRSYNIPGLRLVGFEPAKNLIEDARKGTNQIFNDFFGYKLFRQNFSPSSATIITSIAMFYDLDDPNTFVADVQKCLAANGVWIVQQNYLPLMVERNGFDNIGHEHLAYYSLETMNRLLLRHHLQIFDAEVNDVNGGSFRTYIAHEGRFPTKKRVKELEAHEHRLFSRKPSIYKRFSGNVKAMRIRLRDFIKSQAKAGKTIYVYGASTRGNTILQYCELDHRFIKKATDANPEKWGLRIPGTEIPIISKSEARRDAPDFFLILPHHFLKEIEAEERQYLDSGGRFIVPLPRFRIVDAERRQQRELTC